MSKLLSLIISLILGMNLLSQESFIFNPDHPCASFKKLQIPKISSYTLPQTPRLHDYDITFYFLDLLVSDESRALRGMVRMDAIVKKEEMDTFAFELIDQMIIDSLAVNNQIHNFVRANNECFVALANPLPQNSSITVKIWYGGVPPSGGFFTGVSTAYDSVWGKHVTWTLSEPFNARQWWPTKQILEDKADSVWVYLTTENGKKAGSIGLLENVVQLPGNKVRYEWKSRYPIAYYLISYTVAEYQDYSIYSKPQELNGDSILIQNFIYDTPGCLQHYKTGIDRTAVMIQLFSDLYSLYPFHEEKYGHCLALISGGMEHQTMTTLHDFGLLLVSHELGHMWFGDNVTCATWSDIWVNEGFATYTDYLAHEKIAGQPYPKIWMKNAHNYVKSQPGGSVYVPPAEVTYENVSRIFDSRLTYYKGALMLHMIRYELADDDLFFQVYKNYQSAFRDSVATGLDFLNILNLTTGEDFTYFFDQWYFGEGYPIFAFDWQITGSTFELISSQTTSMPSVTPFFDIKFPVKLFLNNGIDTTIQVHQMQETEHIVIPVSGWVDSIQVNPDLWILMKVESINGMDDVATNHHIRLSPNPAEETMLIETLFDKFDLIIIDITGIEHKKMHVSMPSITLSLWDLLPGLYILEISNHEQTIIRKFVKR